MPTPTAALTYLKPRKRTAGADLRVSDTVELIGGDDTIVAFAPYEGSLDWGSGETRIATFARGRQMTIAADQTFDVVVR
jgi:hypothetical protein